MLQELCQLKSLQAVQLQCEIFSLGQILQDVIRRCEFEEHKVKNMQHEVSCLRSRISDLKGVVFSLTKGCPISSLDLRLHKTSRSSSSSSSDVIDNTIYPVIDIDTSLSAQQQARLLFGESCHFVQPSSHCN